MEIGSGLGKRIPGNFRVSVRRCDPRRLPRRTRARKRNSLRSQEAEAAGEGLNSERSGKDQADRMEPDRIDTDQK